jgi:hypothetical protein
MIFDQSKTVQFEFINLLHIPSYVQCVLVVMINSSLFSFLQYSYVLKLCYFSFQFHFLRYTKLLPIAWLLSSSKLYWTDMSLILQTVQQHVLCIWKFCIFTCNASSIIGWIPLTWREIEHITAGRTMMQGRFHWLGVW